MSTMSIDGKLSVVEAVCAVMGDSKRQDNSGACAAPSCDRKAFCKTLCRRHYARMCRNGHLDGSTFEDRLWSRVRKQEDGCWIWTGGIAANGYGAIQINGSQTGIHRYMYQRYCGPIGNDLVLDHLCRVRACCNPAHLEPVSQRENIARGLSVVATYMIATHCSNGHEFTPANTYVRTDGHGRNCRTCIRNNMREYRARRVLANV